MWSMSCVAAARVSRRSPQDRAHMLQAVKALPGLTIGTVPLLVGHDRMMRHAVVEVVFVEVGGHPSAPLPQNLVVFGTGERRQHEQLEHVERQFPLDDLDIAQDGLPRIAGKSDDVPRASDSSVLMPLLQHRAVFGDLVLALLGRKEIIGIDVLQADKDAANAGLRCLLDEVRDPVAQRVHLDRKADLQTFADPQSDHPVKQRFPMTVASKIVIGDEKPSVALAIVFADRAFEIVGGAKPALAALDIDDRAERTLVGAAAAEIEA